MLTDHTPQAALEALRAALTHLRALAAAPSPDPAYARSAAQVAAVVAELEGTAGASLTGGLDPQPPNPGATSGIPDPPSPGITASGT